MKTKEEYKRIFNATLLTSATLQEAIDNFCEYVVEAGEKDDCKAVSKNDELKDCNFDYEGEDKINNALRKLCKDESCSCSNPNPINFCNRCRKTIQPSDAKDEQKAISDEVDKIFPVNPKNVDYKMKDIDTRNHFIRYGIAFAQSQPTVSLPDDEAIAKQFPITIDCIISEHKINPEKISDATVEAIKQVQLSNECRQQGAKWMKSQTKIVDFEEELMKFINFLCKDSERVNEIYDKYKELIIKEYLSQRLNELNK